MAIVIIPAYDQLETVRELFAEYVDWLGIDLSYQNYQEELDTLPGRYALPCGRLYLALAEGKAAGCIAMRPLMDGTCEMKRLYVRPEYRGQGIGGRLVERLTADARAEGYRRMVLDTFRSMDSAVRMYLSMGFVEIAPYYNNPMPDPVFLGKELVAEEGTALRAMNHPGAPKELAEVIARSHATVAEQFGLTKENCPSNPAFITAEQVGRSMEKGAVFWGLYEGARLVGCFALEESGEPGVLYLERVSVLPSHRRRGYGAQLLGEAARQARKRGARKLSIGIIDDNRALKNWYLAHGYREIGARRFDTLPFTVCFLELPV